MKIRKSFVSNSSSASFVVISGKDVIPILSSPLIQNDVLVVDGSYGNTEFGWGFEVYDDFESKLNFAYLQYLSAKHRVSALQTKEDLTKYDQKDLSLLKDHNTWLEILERVVLNNIPSINSIDWQLRDNSDWNSKSYGYIDHQSAACEGENIEIFDDEETLEKFLFGTHSRIHTGNDNV